MSPRPPRTNRQEIVRAAIALIEALDPVPTGAAS